MQSCRPSALRIFLRTRPLYDRQSQQPVELRCRYLRQHAVLELDPQPRHREEHGRPGTLQVRGERLEALGEVHAHAGSELAVLDQRALDHVRQRQVRQHARAAVERDSVQCGLHRPRERLEAVHDALRCAGRAGRVDDRREFFTGTHRLALQRCRACGDVVPPRVALLRVLRRQRKADARQPVGYARLHALPAVELADEQQPGLAVPEDLPDRGGRQRGEQRHRDATREPDGEVAHQPVRRVLREDGDAVAPLQAEALQVRGHASRLVEDLAPRVVAHHAAAQRLRQRHPVGCGLFPEVQSLECQRVVGNDRGHDRLSPAAGQGSAPV